MTAFLLFLSVLVFLFILKVESGGRRKEEVVIKLDPSCSYDNRCYRADCITEEGGPGGPWSGLIVLMLLGLVLPPGLSSSMHVFFSASYRQQGPSPALSVCFAFLTHHRKGIQKCGPLIRISHFKLWEASPLIHTGSFPVLLKSMYMTLHS